MSQSHGMDMSPSRQANFIKPKTLKSPVKKSPSTGGSAAERRAEAIVRGDDSSSDDSVDELNEIFGKFFDTRLDDSIASGASDDDSDEDYQNLASKFDFKYSEDEE